MTPVRTIPNQLTINDVKLPYNNRLKLLNNKDRLKQPAYTPSEPCHSTPTTPKSPKIFTQILDCDDLELDQLLHEMTPTTKSKQPSKNVNSEKCRYAMTNTIFQIG